MCTAHSTEQYKRKVKQIVNNMVQRKTGFECLILCNLNKAIVKQSLCQVILLILALVSSPSDSFFSVLVPCSKIGYSLLEHPAIYTIRIPQILYNNMFVELAVSHNMELKQAFYVLCQCYLRCGRNR